jgi:copper chaperone NosL
LIILILAGCHEQPHSPNPAEITPGTICALDGLRLNDYPGPKGQVHYSHGGIEFFSDTMEMLSIYLGSEPRELIIAIYTQDMGKADWNKPEGNWIDARGAYYVMGSTLHGALGPTLAPFALEAEAQAFSARQGGTVLRFDQVIRDMVDLSGHVSHSRRYGSS